MDVWFLSIEYRQNSDGETLVFSDRDLFNEECERIGKELCATYNLELSDEAKEYNEDAWLFEAEQHSVIYYRTGQTTVKP